MDTSLSNTADNTESQTVTLASIQTLKRHSKKSGTEGVFQLVLESLESNIDKECFDKILELLIKNLKVKTSCYANKTCCCLSLPKVDQINNMHTRDKDNLKQGFNNFKSLMINGFESKYSFFHEVSSFKINF